MFCYNHKNYTVNDSEKTNCLLKQSNLAGCWCVWNKLPLLVILWPWCTILRAWEFAWEIWDLLFRGCLVARWQPRLEVNLDFRRLILTLSLCIWLRSCRSTLCCLSNSFWSSQISFSYTWKLRDDGKYTETPQQSVYLCLTSGFWSSPICLVFACLSSRSFWQASSLISWALHKWARQLEKQDDTLTAFSPLPHSPPLIHFSLISFFRALPLSVPHQALWWHSIKVSLPLRVGTAAQSD